MSREMRSKLAAIEPEKLTWFKSSASVPYGTCVEAATTDGGMLLRDSTDAKGPVLAFSDAEWDAFLVGVRNGEFDH